jgi:hypothetical protein
MLSKQHVRASFVSHSPEEFAGCGLKRLRQGTLRKENVQCTAAHMLAIMCTAHLRLRGIERTFLCHFVLIQSGAKIKASEKLLEILRSAFLPRAKVAKDCSYAVIGLATTARLEHQKGVP